MPKDNIERAIAKGTGAGADAENWEAVVYEGYGPGGVAMLIEAMTDNRNRTGSEVRHLLSKHGGNLGEPGSVAYLFDKKGVIVVDAERYSEDDLMPAIEAGAEDIAQDEDVFEILTEPADLTAVREALVEAGHRARVRRDPLAAEDDGRARRGRRDEAHEAHRRARGQRRRRPGQRELRRVRRGAREGRRIAAEPSRARPRFARHAAAGAWSHLAARRRARARPRPRSTDAVAAPARPTPVREFQGTHRLQPVRRRRRSEYRLAVRRAGAAAREALPSRPPTGRSTPTSARTRTAARSSIYTRCDETLRPVRLLADAPRPASARCATPTTPSTTTSRRRCGAGDRVGADLRRAARPQGRRLHEGAHRAALAAVDPRGCPALPSRRRTGATTGRAVDALELWGDNLAADRRATSADGCAGIEPDRAAPRPRRRPQRRARSPPR